MMWMNARVVMQVAVVCLAGLCSGCADLPPFDDMLPDDLPDGLLAAPTI